MFVKFLFSNLLVLDSIFSCLFIYTEESRLVCAVFVLYEHSESGMFAVQISIWRELFCIIILVT